MSDIQEQNPQEETVLKEEINKRDENTTSTKLNNFQEQIIDDNMKMLFANLNKMGEKEENSQEIQDSKEGLIITISRQHGSQGKAIGEIVANELGIPYYYKEMTAIAAKESGLDKEFVSKISGFPFCILLN